MLTGDKLETAENIARSCRLIQGDMTVLRLATKDEREIDLRMSDNESTFNMCIEENRKRSYLVEGESLALIFASAERTKDFVRVSKDCDSVVCCRVTPKQKVPLNYYQLGTGCQND
jgi:phospholipid-transporting ATPase